MNTTVMLVLACLVIFAFMLPLFGRHGAGKLEVKARRFMTPNETEFLQRLETAAPELRFHAQVAMGALLEPLVARKGNSRAWWRVRNAFSQKVIDYVAQRRDTGQIVAVIELDDRTDDAVKDARRDAMLHQAGYRTVRWHSNSKPNRAEILATLMAPPPAAPVLVVMPPAATQTSVRGELWGTANKR